MNTTVKQSIMSHPLRTHVVITIVFAVLSFFTQAHASTFEVRREKIDSISAELTKQLADLKVSTKMNYPISVKRFYKSNGMKANWLTNDTNIGPTASAMLLLDCVRQFGLQRENYHSEIVNYSNMYTSLSKRADNTVKNKILFEIMLTDAVISMINHLHYGRFNPVYNREVLENDPRVPVRSDELLLRVAKNNNLMLAIADVQPRMAQYKLLQSYLKLIVGQNDCDSYEVPEREVRLISINLERLRWTATEADTYIQINIPSFQLSYNLLEETQKFKVVIGKPTTPTPILISQIEYLETSPDWNIPQKIFINELLPKAEKNHSFFDDTHIGVYDKKGRLINITSQSLKAIRKQPNNFYAKQSAGCDNALGSVVFRFANAYGVYLHDTPQQQFFSRRYRALSHGCIRVERAPELAKIVLAADGQTDRLKLLGNAMELGKNQKFALKYPLTIAITYQTVAVEDGLLVYYDDLYKLNKTLEARIYGNTQRDALLPK